MQSMFCAFLKSYSQAGKSSFLKTTAPYKSTFSSLFYKVYRSANNRPYSLVMPHDILLKLSYSYPSPSQPH